MQWSTCLPVVPGDVVEDLGDAVAPSAHHVLVGGDVRLVGVPADVERGGVLAVVQQAKCGHLSSQKMNILHCH